MAYRQWTSGQLVTAPDFQTYIQDQTFLRFASAAARTAAIPTPSDGMVSYLQDVKRYDTWNGSAWSPLLPTDTGWIGLTPSAGWIQQETMTYRVRGGVVTVTGLASASGNQSANSVIAVLPVGARPSVTMHIISSSYDSPSAQIWGTDGTIRTIPAIASGVWVSLSQTFLVA